nr:integrase core domain-containing protein [Sciscionella marina]
MRPATPRLNGKVERSHRIDAEEFYRLLDGVVLGDIGAFNEKLKEWEDYYNYHRPHGSLDGQTPYERLLQKTQSHPQGVNDQRKQHIVREFRRRCPRVEVAAVTGWTTRSLMQFAGVPRSHTTAEDCLR